MDSLRCSPSILIANFSLEDPFDEEEGLGGSSGDSSNTPLPTH